MSSAETQALDRKSWSNAKNCQLCNNTFTMLKRAHHCRNCGKAVCSNCSNKRVPLSGALQRVCDTCFDQHTQFILNAAESEARNIADSASNASRERSMNDSYLDEINDTERLNTQRSRAPYVLPLPTSLNPSSTPLALTSSLSASNIRNDQSSPEQHKSRVNRTRSGSALSTPPDSPTESYSPPSSPSSISRPSLSKSDSTDLPKIFLDVKVPDTVSLSTNPKVLNFAQSIQKIQQALRGEFDKWNKQNRVDYKAERKEYDQKISHLTSIVNTLRAKLPSTSDPKYDEENERLEYFTSKLADYANYLRKIDIEHYCPDPTGRTYKFRICAEDRTFISAEDVALEVAQGSINITTCDGSIILEVSDLSAILVVYHFAVSGKGSSKLVGSVFSPDRVSLQLSVRRILIPLVYIPPPTTKHAQNAFSSLGKWSIEREKCIFDLSIIKSVKGGATLPDSVIQYFVDRYIPTTLCSVLSTMLPPELGPILTKGLEISIGGRFEMRGEIGCTTWEAPLCKASNESDKARSLLSAIPSIQSRMVLMNNLAEATKSKELTRLSLHRLAKFIRHRSHSVTENARNLWLSLVREWQVMMNELEGTPDSMWFCNLLDRVSTLDDKPLSLSVQIRNLSVKIALVPTIQLYLQYFLKISKDTVDKQKRVEEIEGESKRKTSFHIERESKSDDETASSTANDIKMITSFPRKKNGGSGPPSPQLPPVHPSTPPKPLNLANRPTGKSDNTLGKHLSIASKANKTEAGRSLTPLPNVSQPSSPKDSNNSKQRMRSVSHSDAFSALEVDGPKVLRNVDVITSDPKAVSSNLKELDNIETSGASLLSKALSEAPPVPVVARPAAPARLSNADVLLEKVMVDDEPVAAPAGVSSDQMWTAALDWCDTVRTWSVYLMDHCKSLTFAIRCGVLGGTAAPNKVSSGKRNPATTIERITATGEANAQLQISDVVAQVVFPPLQLVFEAYDLVRRMQMSFPAYRVASRVHPDGDHLQIIVDISDPAEPDTPSKVINPSATYTYNIGIHSSHLDLFPRLFPGNIIQLPSVNSHSSIPHLNLSLSNISVEGPLSPVFNFDHFFHIAETVNQWKKRGEVEIQKEENKKAKDSLLSLVKAQQVIDYNNVLLPYLFAGKHELRTTIRVEVMVASIVPMQDSSPMDETPQLPSTSDESASSNTVKIPTEVERKVEVEKKLDAHSHTQLLIYNPPLKRRKSSTNNSPSNMSNNELSSQFARQSLDESFAPENGRKLTFRDPISESIKDDICIGISFKCTLLQLIHDILLLSGLNQ